MTSAPPSTPPRTRREIFPHPQRLIVTATFEFFEHDDENGGTKAMVCIPIHDYDDQFTYQVCDVPAPEKGTGKRDSTYHAQRGVGFLSLAPTCDARIIGPNASVDRFMLQTLVLTVWKDLREAGCEMGEDDPEITPFTPHPNSHGKVAPTISTTWSCSSGVMWTPRERTPEQMSAFAEKMKALRREVFFDEAELSITKACRQG